MLHSYAIATERSRAAHEAAKRFLPGGVTGAGRTDAPFPITIAEAHGSTLVDVDGNVYLDYHGGLGSAVLGYAHPEVDEAVRSEMGRLSTFVGGPHSMELRLAERFCQLVPSVDKVAFCGGGGSDAIQHAVRIARAHTSRMRILRVEGGYHGWHSDVAVSSRPILKDPEYVGLPSPKSDSAGVLPAVTEQVIVASVNDQAAIHQAFAQWGPQIACVIIEPVLFSAGAVLVDQPYLRLVRQLCDRHGSVLIFDEVLTGFRCALGSMSPVVGVVPDLTVFGKALANGYMMSALGGRAGLMAELAPDGPVYYAGTFNGHPLSLAAALKTLEVLERDDVPSKISALGERLTRGVNRAIQDLGINAVCQHYGSIWTLYFGCRSVHSYRELPRQILTGSDQMTADFRWYLRQRGIYVHQRYVPRCCISAVHTEEDIDRTVEVVGDYLDSRRHELAAL